MRRPLLSMLVCLAMVGMTRPASAEPAEADATREAPARSFVLSWNPVAMGVGRLSIDAQLRIAPHHALSASIALASASFEPDMPASDFGNGCTALPCRDLGPGPMHARGVLVEIGWRFYTSALSPSGFFLAPSALVGAIDPAGAPTSVRWGGALDVGYQLVTSAGFAFGFGVGIAAVRVPRELPPSNIAVGSLTQSGVQPRALLSVGWAF